MLGSMGAAWLVRLPDIKKDLHISSSELGWIFLVSAIGGLAAMQLAPWLLKRFGHKRTLSVLSYTYPLTFFTIPLANSMLSLTAALVLTGGLGALIGILANTHAADVERAYERAIMSSFHALYSIGSLVGAGAAGVLAGWHLSPLVSIGGAAVVYLTLVILFVPWLLRVASATSADVDASMDHVSHHKHRHNWWRGVLLVGSITFVAYIAESTVANWSTIFMTQERGADAGLAATAFMAFSACMAAGRLAGDYLANRFGKVTVVQYGAFIASVGLFFGMLIPSTAAAVIGFALVGCGMSVLVPLLFSIAGNLSGGESNAAIARVGTIAYIGILAGPVVIGGVAEHQGLVIALLIPAFMLLYVVTASNLIPQVVRRRGRGRQILTTARNWLLQR